MNRSAKTPNSAHSWSAWSKSLRICKSRPKQQNSPRYLALSNFSSCCGLRPSPIRRILSAVPDLRTSIHGSECNRARFLPFFVQRLFPRRPRLLPYFAIASSLLTLVRVPSFLRPKRARSSRIIATWISVSLVWTLRS